MIKRSLQAKFILPVSILIAVTTLSLIVIISVSQSNSIEQDAKSEIVEKVATVNRLLTVTDAIMMERVKSSMKLLLERGESLGAARQGDIVEVNGKNAPELLLGSQPQSNRFELVDHLTASQGGDATLFSKAGDDYVRISTTVKNSVGSSAQDIGKRAVGTILDPSGKAIKAIREGKSFYGQVDILGHPYLTGYEPIFNSQKKTVGIWLVAYKVDTKSLQEAIGKSRILNSGFVALADDKGKVLFNSDNITSESAMKIMSGSTPGWEVKREVFGPWGFEVVGAYPRDEVAGAIRKTVLLIVIAGIVLGGLVVGLLFWLSRSLVIAPLRDAIAVARKIADGDLSSTVVVTRDDEIGALLGAMKSMQDGLGQIIGNVNGSARKLAQSAGQLASMAGLVTKSASRQQGMSQSIAAAVEEMSSTVAEITSTMEELSASSTQIADHSRSVVDIANQTLENSRKGSAGMQILLNRMTDIRSDNQSSLQEIVELGSKSKEISKVMQIIDTIADQTKLIAFNAALEASSAGDAGKRFGVVASEIRRLADSVTESTNEIEAKVQEIQDSISRLVITSEKGANTIAVGMEASATTAQHFDDLVKAASHTSSAAQQISLSTQQQRTASDQVVMALREIVAASSQTAQSVKGITEISSEMNVLSSDLCELVSQFRLAESLKQTEA